MKRRITLIAILMVVMLFGLLSVARADDKEKLSIGGNLTVRSLSIEDALELARQNNVTLKLAEIDKNKAYIEANQARVAANHTAQEFDSERTSDIQAKYLNEKAKEALKVVADKAYQVADKQVALQVEKNYYAVLEAQELVNVSKAALERAEKQMEQAQANFNVGTAAKTDVLSAEVGLSNAKAGLTSAKNKYENAVIALNRVIGLDLHTPLGLTTKVKYESMSEVDLNKAIEGAMSTRLDLAKVEAEKFIADENSKLMAQFISGTFTYKQAKIDAEKKAINVSDTKMQVVADLTQAYLNIKAADDSLNYLKVGVEQAEENVRLTTLRYQVGMATVVEVLDASVKLSDIQQKRIKALYDYNLAKLSFETAKMAPLSASSGS